MTHKKQWYNKVSGGYITLMSVLIVSTIGLSIVPTLILLGIGQSQTSVIFEKSKHSKAHANACAEEALQQIRDNTNYSGSGNMTFTYGTCNYNVTVLSGQNRIIDSTGVSGTATHKIKINIDTINPLIHVVSWKEVSDL